MIFGKTWLYLTPTRVHNIPNYDVLKVGTFLPDPVNGLPDTKTGNFTDVLVADHIPIPPNIKTFKIKDETYNYGSNNTVIVCGNIVKDINLFSWNAAIDSNDRPLIKSNSPDSTDPRNWIQDQCKIKYTLRIEEYPGYIFNNNPDTNSWVRISSPELDNIFKFLIPGQASVKDIYVNYSIICEDEVYNYNNPEYSNKLTSAKKSLILHKMCGDEVKDKNEIPSHNFLNQNHPNPFNPNTIITYGLLNESNVNLTIFNIFGQTVRTLLNEKQSAGYKNITWDGRNDKGIPVSSGTYIYTIKSGDFVKVKKMHLIK
jgi:hypothetical protein